MNRRDALIVMAGSGGAILMGAMEQAVGQSQSNRSRLGIASNALKVPVLTDGYWATLSDTPAHELARTWRLIKTRSHPEPLTVVSKLPEAEQRELERRNLERSLAYARDQLGL